VVSTHSAAGRARVLVSGVVKGRSCRSIMLRQEKLAIVKDISTLQLSLALLREMRMAKSRRKKPVVPAGSRRTPLGRGAGAPQRPSRQLAGKLKATEQASSADSAKPVNRRPALDAGSATSSSVTG
jgi:hypothetical protein